MSWQPTESGRRKRQTSQAKRFYSSKVWGLWLILFLLCREGARLLGKAVSYKKKLDACEAKKRQLENERELLSEQRDCREEVAFPFDQSRLLHWVRRHTTIAYQCDLDDWFILDDAESALFDFAGYEDGHRDFFAWSDATLVRLLACVENLLTQSKDPPKISALRELANAVKWTRSTLLPSVEKITEQLEDCERRLAEIETEIARLEPESDTAFDVMIEHGDRTRSVHRVSWGVDQSTEAVSSDDFSYSAVTWLSSSVGQAVLADLDAWIAARADAGEGCISIEYENVTNGVWLIFSDDQRLLFVSLFDFKVVMTRCGYGISHGPTTDTRGYLKISW
jgi:hypothetical protein